MPTIQPVRSLAQELNELVTPAQIEQLLGRTHLPLPARTLRHLSIQVIPTSCEPLLIAAPLKEFLPLEFVNKPKPLRAARRLGSPRGQLTWGSGSSFSRVVSVDRMACQRSQSCCNPSQKSALIPVTRAKRSAVSGVTARLPRMISFKRGNDTPRRTAKDDCDRPKGLRNSSRSISPGCVGG